MTKSPHSKAKPARALNSQALVQFAPRPKATATSVLSTSVKSACSIMVAMARATRRKVLLLTSSITLTIAHHALIAGKRAQVTAFLAATFILGFIFVYLQGVEYVEAYEHLNLKLTSGIYGSTFFMLTGFHGMHVSIGAIMLTVIWFRVMKGHFSADNHFAFEAVAWYWHFVDVVWIGLYVFVYWM